MYNYLVFLLYKFASMILKTSQNQKKVRDNLDEICGKSFSLIEKINLNLLGSPKYLIKSISPTTFDLDFKNFSDLIYCSIELRKNGVAVYFRYKNEEYVILSRFNQITFISNDQTFDFQLGNLLLNLKITDSKGHHKFISRLMKCRNRIKR